jgi:hypothetical protein
MFQDIGAVSLVKFIKAGRSAMASLGETWSRRTASVTAIVAKT